MTFGINPIAAEASRKALVENDRLDAHHNETNASRAALDAEELHDLEHSLFYSATTGTIAVTPAGTPEAASPQSAPLPAPAEALPAAARRTLLYRLFRRR
jgi:hypothetical protein